MCHYELSISIFYIQIVVSYKIFFKLTFQYVQICICSCDILTFHFQHQENLISKNFRQTLLHIF